ATPQARAAGAVAQPFGFHPDRGQRFHDLDGRIRDVTGEAQAADAILAGGRALASVEEISHGEGALVTLPGQVQAPERRAAGRLDDLRQDRSERLEDGRAQEVADHRSPSHRGRVTWIEDRALRR